MMLGAVSLWFPINFSFRSSCYVLEGSILTELERLNSRDDWIKAGHRLHKERRTNIKNAWMLMIPCSIPTKDIDGMIISSKVEITSVLQRTIAKAAKDVPCDVSVCSSRLGVQFIG